MATTVTVLSAWQLEDRFYVAMAAACAAIAFVGFASTYWLQLPAGTFKGSPLLHLHGLIYSAWTLLFLYQATLIAGGRRINHRAWGLLGIALATAMVFTGAAVAIAGMNSRIARGQGDAARAFAIVSITLVLLFAVLVAAAFATRRRPDWHKRLMLVATASILQPAMARFFFLAATGGGPGLRPGLGPARSVESTMLAGFLADILIVVAMTFDWRTRRRPHPAYLWGFGAVLTVQLLRVPLSKTPAWLSFTDFLAGFSG